jgi:hypothetical protein
VLGYRVTPYHRSKTDVFERIQNSVQFPGDTFIIDLDGENYQLKRKFRRLRFSRILNPARGLGMSAMNVISTTIKKLFGFLAVLFGIGGSAAPIRGVYFRRKAEKSRFLVLSFVRDYFWAHYDHCRIQVVEGSYRLACWY